MPLTGERFGGARWVLVECYKREVIPRRFLFLFGFSFLLKKKFTRDVIVE